MWAAEKTQTSSNGGAAMKKLLLVILACILILCSCTPKENPENDNLPNQIECSDDASEGKGIDESSFEKYPIKIFKADGKLYYDTGEYVVQSIRKCGTLDGMFEEFCDEYEIPQNDGQSNFKSNDTYYENGWQSTSANIKEVPTTDGWKIFRRVETDLKTGLSDYEYCMRLCGKLPDDEEKSEYIVFTNNKDADFADVLAQLSDNTKEAYLIPVKYGEVYDWGLTLSAKDVTPTGLTLVFTQKGGSPKGTLEIGEQYSLDVWNGSFWESVPYKPLEYDIAWHAIAYIIPKDADSEFSISWEYLYGELENGKYRISKEVSDFVVANNYDKHTYYAEFEIGE